MSDSIDVVVESPAPIDVEVLIGGSGAPLSDDMPEDLGTAAAGVSMEASRSDHVHAMPSAVDVGADPAGAANAVAGDLSTHESLTTSAHGGIVGDADPRLTDARTPLAHTHGQSDVTGLVADMAAKQPLDSDLTAIAALSTTAFGRSLLEVVDAAGGRAALSAAAASHTHSGADITSGVVAPARLGSGTADSSKVLRGDGSWGTGRWRIPGFYGSSAASALQGTTAVAIGNAGQVVLLANSVVMWRILPVDDVVVSDMILAVQNAGASGTTVKGGVYAATASGIVGLPAGAPLAQSAAVPANVAGFNYVPLTAPLALKAGVLYYGALVTDSPVFDMRIFTSAGTNSSSHAAVLEMPRGSQPSGPTPSQSDTQIIRHTTTGATLPTMTAPYLNSSNNNMSPAVFWNVTT